MVPKLLFVSILAYSLILVNAKSIHSPVQIGEEFRPVKEVGNCTSLKRNDEKPPSSTEGIPSSTTHLTFPDLLLPPIEDVNVTISETDFEELTAVVEIPHILNPNQSEKKEKIVA